MAAIDMKTADDLMKAAMEARGNAYAPYSGYSVGAAVLCSDGSVYTGCNVESASYPCGVCAERVAVANAVSDGKRKIKVVAVIGSSAKICTPCGMCRQFLYEFNDDMAIICGDGAGVFEIYSLTELLPFGFGSSSLG